MQVSDLDSPECHIPARGPLRVVHSRGNQIVDIDGLDVKCALHSLATGAQKIDNMLLIRGGIKGCPRFRLSCELTECQSDSENLDENSIHLGPHSAFEVPSTLRTIPTPGRSVEVPVRRGTATQKNVGSCIGMRRERQEQRSHRARSDVPQGDWYERLASHQKFG